MVAAESFPRTRALNEREWAAAVPVPPGAPPRLTRTRRLSPAAAERLRQGTIRVRNAISDEEIPDLEVVPPSPEETQFLRNRAVRVEAALRRLAVRHVPPQNPEERTRVDSRSQRINDALNAWNDARHHHHEESPRR